MKIERTTKRLPNRAPVRSRLTLHLQGSKTGIPSEWLALLPLQAEHRNKLSLEHHLQLAALHAGLGSRMSLKLLMRVALMSCILQQLGYGALQARPMEDYEAAALGSMSSSTCGEYCLEGESFRLFANLVTYHDKQLEIVPQKALSYAADKLEKYGKAA